MRRDTGMRNLSPADIVAAVDRVHSREDVKREVRQLITGKVVDARALDETWEEISKNNFSLTGLSKDRTTSQNSERFEHLLELMFHLGLEAKWHKGTREAGLLNMHLLLDKMQRFDDAIAWGSLLIGSTDDREVRQIGHGDVGLALIHKGNLDEAIRNITVALELATEREDSYYIAKYLGDLAVAYSRNDNPERAAGYLSRALEVGKSVPDFEYDSKFRQDLNTIQEYMRHEKNLKHFLN